MGARWRRPFCTSIRRDPEAAAAPTSAAEKHGISPRICAKLGGLFSGGGSNPSTPRLLSRTAPSTPTLRCRTIPAHPDSPRAALATPPPPRESSGDPKRSPKKLLQPSSEPCSPRSPSKFALFKASLRFSRSRCGVCAQSVRTAIGAAVFTAECSHAFHLACIASHAAASLVCPVCSVTWRHTPLLPSSTTGALQADDGCRLKATGGGGGGGRMRKPSPQQQQQHRRLDKIGAGAGAESKSVATAACRLYDDDEPLLPHNTLAGRFNPIPEEADDEEDEAEDSRAEEGALQRIFPTPPSSSDRGVDHRGPAPQGKASGSTGIEVSVMPEAALVSAGRSHRSYVVALKVRAPPPTAAAVPLLDPTRRAPIDLVTVLDVRGSMAGDKLHVLKRAMRHLISSLGPGDRLSIVAFSASAAKRLLPLHRMSRQGQRSARHIVDRLIVSATALQGHGGGADALRKATKVLEDRRERNPVATIMLLSDGAHQNQQQSTAEKSRTPAGATTHLANLEVPIRRFEEEEDPFTKCVLGGLLSVLFQDVHLRFTTFPSGEISAAYSCGGGSSGRAAALGGGSSVRLGHLHAGEEKELLVEFRVLVDGTVPHQQTHMMSVTCSYRDAATHELICGPEQPLPMPPLQSSNGNPYPQFLRSNSSFNVQRLRNLFVATRAVAESRRLADLHDLATAVHLLSSARSLLLQSTAVASDKNLVQSLEAELADLQRLRHQQQQLPLSPPPERSRGMRPLTSTAAGDDARESLTPTSAWRAAEQLAKLAIMRKSLNQVSDLHGFESARF